MWEMVGKSRFGYIYGCTTHKVISPRGISLLDTRVCDFIDAENRCWNLNLLHRTFLPFEAEEIAGIPLSVRLPDDKQVWAETFNVFSQ